nr:cytochrome b-c1 complex subunit 7-like [Mirounga angustirostris]
MLNIQGVQELKKKNYLKYYFKGNAAASGQNASRPAVAPSSRWLQGIRKWYYNAAGFNKLGLMRNDTIYENDDVKEAIRLPENLYNDRMFRIKRALDLTMRHQILPKEQWTKYEEDKFYLEPYLKEVIRERKEREWAKK